MKRLWLLALIGALMIGMGLMFAACGDDDDDNDNNDDNNADDDTAADDDVVDDDTTDDDTTDDDTTDDDTIEPGTIGGTCLDFLSENPILGATVEAVRDDNGASFEPPVTGTSDATTGYVQLTLPADYDLQSVGIKLVADTYKNTFQYHFTVGATEERFLGVSNTTVNLIAALLFVTVDPTKGHAAGGVFWGAPLDETPVGCAEVALDPASGTVYYMNNLGLPTHDRDITTPGDPQDGEGTNPTNGYFVGLNADPVTFADGGYTMNANADGNLGTSLLPKLDADSVAISNVYYSKSEFTTNPQGAWCTE